MGHLYDHQYGDECGWSSDEYLLSVWRGDREWHSDDASGVFTISSVIQGILLMLVGCFWVVSLLFIIGGVVCDLLVLRGGKITMGAMKIAFAVFSGFFQLGYLFPFVFMKDAFTDVMLGNGISQEFIDSLFGVTAGVMPVVIVALGVICGFIGATIGQRVLKKHFIKAGLVSIKK